jgi:hypothetical protein
MNKQPNHRCAFGPEPGSETGARPGVSPHPDEGHPTVGSRTALVVSLAVLFWFGIFFNPAGIWITDVLGASA